MKTLKQISKSLAIIAIVALGIGIIIPSVIKGPRIGAICKDGWRSSATGRGACSHHGGVDHWIYVERPSPLKEIKQPLLVLGGSSFIGYIIFSAIIRRRRQINDQLNR